MPSRVGARVPTSPEVVHRYSRWRSDATTFGPAGRVVITVLVLAIGLLMVPGGLTGLDVGGLLVWYAVVTPLVLRDVWKRSRRARRG
ncbi:MAG: hypothetical protein ACYCXA_11560 [Actinomycetes bacterium]